MPDDFGLIECAKCGAPLLVHMDGRVEHSGAQVLEEAAAAPADAPVEQVVHAPDDEHSGFSGGQREIELEPTSETAESTLIQEPADFGPPDLSPAVEDEDSVPLEQPAHEDHDKSFHFTDQAEAETPPAANYSPAPAAPTDPSSPDLSDIARFGNSDSTAHDGSLRYRIFITGIDTADVRNDFREAITDRKMMWDSDEILRGIKNGEVEMQNISPVKAYILISRLRTLPVQVRWEQYAIVQS